jgi:hypothetical protein
MAGDKKAQEFLDSLKGVTPANTPAPTKQEAAPTQGGDEKAAAFLQSLQAPAQPTVEVPAERSLTQLPSVRAKGAGLPAERILPQEPIGDLVSAFAKGLNESPEFQIAEAIEGPETTGTLGRFVRSKRDFQSSTTGESLVENIAPFITPGAIAGGNLLRSVKAGAKIIPSLGKAKSLLSKIVAGAAEAGAIGAGEQAAVTGARQIKEGGLDVPEFVGEVLETGLSGAAFGGVLGPVANNLIRAGKLKSLKFQQRAKKQFDAPFTKPLPSSQFGVDAESKALIGSIGDVQTLRTKLHRELEQSVTPIARKSILETRLARLEHVEKSILSRAQDITQPAIVKAKKDAQRLLGDATVKINGRDEFLFDQALSKSGKIVPVEEIQKISSAVDVSKFDISVASPKDYMRLLQKVDGGIRGFYTRSFGEPIMQKLSTAELEGKAIRDALGTSFNKIRGNYKARKELLFDAAEGKPVKVSPDEREFLNFLASNYNGLIRRMNVELIKVGQKPIKTRQNYITHLTEMADNIDRGISLDGVRSTRPKTIPFRFAKARKGAGNVIKDPLQAFNDYLDPALKKIHLTGVGADVEARAVFAPPNIRDATLDMVNHVVLGQKRPIDQLIADTIPKVWRDRAASTNNAVIESIIGQSLRVGIQQLSQLIPTAVQTGPSYAVRGLINARKNPPKEIMDLSTFLPTRTIKKEYSSLANITDIGKKRSLLTKDIVDEADRFVARQTWYSGFLHGKEKMKLSDQGAAIWADSLATMLHARYQDLYRPRLFQSGFAKKVIPFQTFLTNQINFITSDPKILAQLNNTSTGREIIKVIGGMLATNQTMHMVGLPTPFGNIVPSEVAQEIAQSESLKETTLIARDLGREALQQVPVVGGLFFEGTNVPIPNPLAQVVANEIIDPITGQDFVRGRSMVEDLWKAAFSDDPDEQAKLLLKAAKKGPLKFIKGGSQIARTAQGLTAIKDGFYKIGSEEVDFDGLDKAISAVFGPFQAPSAQKVFQERDRKKRKNLADDL